MQHNTETWEFYMLKRLERSYMWLPTVTEFHLFADRSFMLLAKNEYPSLLVCSTVVFVGCALMCVEILTMDSNTTLPPQDMVNIFKQQNKKVEEAVIIFYGIELVKMVRKLFAEGVIHGDIKPDNLMIRFHESRSLPMHEVTLCVLWAVMVTLSNRTIETKSTPSPPIPFSLAPM